MKKLHTIVDGTERSIPGTIYKIEEYTTQEKADSVK